MANETHDTYVYAIATCATQDQLLKHLDENLKQTSKTHETIEI
jgi:hypothetical protein